MTKISIIVPCYQSGLNIPVTSAKLIETESLFSDDVRFEYVLVDDGSTDNTFTELKKFYEQYPDKVKVIKLTRNFSSTNAVFAALRHATGDCNIIVSADLQDPPDELFPKMYEHWKKGYKLVVARRSERQEPLLQKMISNATHFLFKLFALKNLPAGGFDMNLFDKEVREQLLSMKESNAYFPYLLIWLGYEFVSVPYVRRKREIGTSAYTFSKKVKAFIDSFVAFTYAPIRMISIVGIILGVAAFLYGTAVIIGKLLGAVDVEGWSSIMVVLLFVSSFQMLALGILGEYIWRISDSARQRPNYVIDEVLSK